jgi:hypothetical protein
MKFYSKNARACYLGGLMMVLAGCGGSSSGVSADADSSGGAPSVSFSVTPSVVSSGGSVAVNWSSNLAESCQASGGWSGGKATSGSETVGPINQNTTLSLSCSGAGGGTVRSVDVVVDQGTGSDVLLSADPENVTSGSTTTLSWSASSANSCSASGDWSGSRPLSGSEVVGPISADASYQLTCDGPSGNSVAMVTVRVADKTLRWQAPSQNVDGTPLDDLAGYVIYWGTNSRNYTDSQTISSPATTQWVATMAPGEYYFALTAFDSENNESGYSNEILKIIP